jgi:hypothetical protein
MISQFESALAASMYPEHLSNDASSMTADIKIEKSSQVPIFN